MAADKAKEIDAKIDADAAAKEAERQAELEAAEGSAGSVVDMDKQEEAEAKKLKEDVNKLTAQAEANAAAADEKSELLKAAVAKKEAEFAAG